MMKSLVETTSHFFTPGITTSRDKRKRKLNQKVELKNSLIRYLVKYSMRMARVECENTGNRNKGFLAIFA